MMDHELSLKDKLSLSEALGLGKREMISLVGAGGKTTLMFRLARELFLKGERVITTTTTKILEPSENESPHLFVSEDETEIQASINHLFDTYGQFTLAKERIGGGKLRGISPELADHLWTLYNINSMIIEADGAAGRPVKAPRIGEPVIPTLTTLVVGILGLDGVGRKLNNQHIFQADLVSNLTGIPAGEKMTEEGMAILMTHREGIFKGAPDSARRVAFLNKVDVPDGIIHGRRIARMIYEKDDSLIERIILGQLKGEKPVAEVFFSKD